MCALALQILTLRTHTKQCELQSKSIENKIHNTRYIFLYFSYAFISKSKILSHLCLDHVTLHHVD